MKGRIIPASILGSTEKVPTHTNPPVYYGAKPSHPPTIQRGELLSSQRCAVEDSLITEEVPTTPQRASDKRTSAALHDTPSFLLKRRSVAESLLDDNSEFSLSLNVSGLNQSGAAHPLPSGREISFHSCSSIAADGTYLFCARYAPHYLYIYDKDGRQLFDVPLVMGDLGEPEFLSVVDGVLYIGGNDPTWTGGYFAALELKDVTKGQAGGWKK